MPRCWVAAIAPLARCGVHIQDLASGAGSVMLGPESLEIRQTAGRDMGKQLLGALMMFVAVWLLPYTQFADVDAQGLDTLRMILLVLIRGGCFLVLFGIFFAGLKVFVAGLVREWSSRSSGSRPPS